jgi:hypothetical protein
MANEQRELYRGEGWVLVEDPRYGYPGVGRLGFYDPNGVCASFRCTVPMTILRADLVVAPQKRDYDAYRRSRYLSVLWTAEGPGSWTGECPAGFGAVPL